MQKDVNVIECPGCGLKLNQQFEMHSRYNASAECYQKYSELSSYTMGKQDIQFIHQHAIDTYSAQHSGNEIKKITIAFSLIGLYYAIEHRFNGRQVQRVHTLLSRQKYNWDELQFQQPDKSSFSLTVFDVLKEQDGEIREEMLYGASLHVWNTQIMQRRIFL